MKPEIIHFKSITEMHQLFQVANAKQPFVSVFRHSGLVILSKFTCSSFTTKLYIIGLKEKHEAIEIHGKETYEIQEETIIDLSPSQVASLNSDTFLKREEEWTLIFHPDFLTTSRDNEIKNYHFFSYSTNETFQFSDQEKKALNDLITIVEKQYYQQFDIKTQQTISISIDTLLKYCEHFYTRQFITRKTSNNRYISKFEAYLKKYFAQNLIDKGLPSVKQCGEAMSLSPNYLSVLLKEETGKNTKQHIDIYVIKKAKILLLNHELSVSQVAFEVGFQYANHFSKFFKSKTGLSPSEYRNSN